MDERYPPTARPTVSNDQAGATDDEIVVLDGPAASDPQVVGALVERLRATPDLDAVGVVVPVVDAVKAVDESGLVVAGVDRAALVTLGRPVAVRRRALDPVSGEPRPRRIGSV
jgi:2-C-methyl-D-erythritol 4-phosphate cytidylyltransferase